MRLLRQFAREYVPQFSVDHVMNTYWDSEFLFEKLLGRSVYTVDENNPINTVGRVVIPPAPAFNHIQPMISTVKTRPYCCRDNREEEIARVGFVTLTLDMDEDPDQTLQDLVEQRLNQDRIIDDGYECPHCKRFLPRFEMTERLVDSISALPIYLRTRDHRRQIQFGNDITIHSLNNGPIEFTMIGCIQFTGILN